jgi:hypothetical protein
MGVLAGRGEEKKNPGGARRLSVREKKKLSFLGFFFLMCCLLFNCKIALLVLSFGSIFIGKILSGIQN